MAMRNFFHAIKKFALWKKLVVGIAVALILLTWLAVCLVLTSYWGS